MNPELQQPQLHKNLVKADVSARIDIYKGMWHVFQMSPLKNAYDAMNKIAEFIFDICQKKKEIRNFYRINKK